MKIRIFRKLQRFLNILPMCFRLKIYQMFGMKIGEGSLLLPGCYVENPKNITLGKNCYINSGVKFCNGLQSAITIGDNVYISFDVKFLGTTHEFGPEFRRAGKTIYKPICVETGAWIGAGAIILPGISIGRGAVVGAGAVVTKDIASNTAVAGVPAPVIRKF